VSILFPLAANPSEFWRYRDRLERRRSLQSAVGACRSPCAFCWHAGSARRSDGRVLQPSRHFCIDKRVWIYI